MLKEFWTGQLAKQRFENMDAQLWQTPDVKAMFLDGYEKVRHNIRTFAGHLEAQTELTPKQRQLMRELSGGLLVELQRTLIQGDIDEHVKPLQRCSAEAMLELADEDDGL